MISADPARTSLARETRQHYGIRPITSHWKISASAGEDRDMARNTPHPATLAAQALGWIDEQTGAVVLPVHTATTFLRDPDNKYRRGRNYARADNASYDQPEALITALEGGAASLVLASGMAA